MPLFNFRGLWGWFFFLLGVIFYKCSGQLPLTYPWLKPAKLTQNLWNISFKLEVAIFILPIPLLSFGWAVAELGSQSPSQLSTGTVRSICNEENSCPYVDVWACWCCEAASQFHLIQGPTGRGHLAAAWGTWRSSQLEVTFYSRHQALDSQHERAQSLFARILASNSCNICTDIDTAMCWFSSWVGFRQSFGCSSMSVKCWHALR